MFSLVSWPPEFRSIGIRSIPIWPQMLIMTATELRPLPASHAVFPPFIQRELKAAAALKSLPAIDAANQRAVDLGLCRPATENKAKEAT